MCWALALHNVNAQDDFCRSIFEPYRKRVHSEEQPKERDRGCGKPN
jgi:hypothetical protein